MEIPELENRDVRNGINPGFPSSKESTGDLSERATGAAG